MSMNAQSTPMASFKLCQRDRGVPLSCSLTLCICFMLALSAHAQISLSTAVDLALRDNPRVQAAQADVDKARAQLSEAHDVYVPSINAGAAVGQSYGYSPYPPTLFTVTGGGLVLSASQSSYIRSARAGVDAAQLAFDDVRESVAEDTALAFLTLEYDQQREQVVGQQEGFSKTLVTIVLERVDAGQDTAIELHPGQTYRCPASPHKPARRRPNGNRP